MSPYDLKVAATIRRIDDLAAIGEQIHRFISPGFCPQCGHDDGMQPIDWRGVDWLADEDIYTDSTGQMYTPCYECNPNGGTIPEGYWTAEPHAVMVWAIADKRAELDEIGDNAAEKEDWMRRYEKGSA